MRQLLLVAVLTLTSCTNSPNAAHNTFTALMSLAAICEKDVVRAIDIMGDFRYP